MDTTQGRSRAARAGILLNRRFAKRRVTALCAAVGICQIWNTDLRYKPVEFFSKYQVVSKPVPTFVAAADIQMKMRAARSCTL
jgi:hypothetical protein